MYMGKASRAGSASPEALDLQPCEHGLFHTVG